MRGKIAQDKLPDYAKGVKVSTMPVIIVSAYADEGPRALDLSGADQFFAKPVDFIKLSLALATISAQTAMRMLDVSKAT